MLVSSVATRARRHYRAQQLLAVAGVRAVRKAVKASRTPQAAKVAAAGTLATYQAVSALNGARTVAAEFDRSPLTTPTQYAGTTHLGYPVQVPIETVIDRLTGDLDGELERLTNAMLASLDLLVESEIIASGADASSVEIAAEDSRYVRVLTPPSCDRCTILAGRIYRSAERFRRHPKCDCQHWPVGSEDEAREAGLIVDPMEAFERGLVGGSRTLPDGSKGFESGFSAADVRAIQDGADIVTVANAKAGGGRRLGITNAITADMFGRTVYGTTLGTTARAAWRRANPKLPIRLRPESIYAHAKDREDALRLLRLYGYLRP